jgi:hypothetical protein
MTAEQFFAAPIGLLNMRFASAPINDPQAGGFHAGATSGSRGAATSA